MMKRPAAVRSAERPAKKRPAAGTGAGPRLKRRPAAARVVETSVKKRPAAVEAVAETEEAAVVAGTVDVVGVVKTTASAEAAEEEQVETPHPAQDAWSNALPPLGEEAKKFPKKATLHAGYRLSWFGANATFYHMPPNKKNIVQERCPARGGYRLRLQVGPGAFGYRIAQDDGTPLYDGAGAAKFAPETFEVLTDGHVSIQKDMWAVRSVGSAWLCQVVIDVPAEAVGRRSKEVAPPPGVGLHPLFEDTCVRIWCLESPHGLEGLDWEWKGHRFLMDTTCFTARGVSKRAPIADCSFCKAGSIGMPVPDTPKGDGPLRTYVMEFKWTLG